MKSTLSKTIEIGGIEIQASVEYVANVVDNGIGAYEFWGDRCVDVRMEWEVDRIFNFQLDDSIPLTVKTYLRPRQFHTRKKYLKACRRMVRQVEKAFKRADAEEFFSDEEIIADASSFDSREYEY